MITTLLVALKGFLKESFQLRVMLLNMFFSLREEHTSRRKPRPLNKKEVLSTMAKDVKDLWIKASISQLFGEKYLRRKICRNLNQYKSAVKALLSNENSKLVEEFKGKVDKLFDIRLCHCEVETKELMGKLLCKFPRSDRVYIKEVEFFYDQRESRALKISSIDKRKSIKCIKAAN